jgi:hypothetical protein
VPVRLGGIWPRGPSDAPCVDHDAAEERARTAEAGFDRHLTKLVDPKLLQTLMQTARGIRASRLRGRRLVVPDKGTGGPEDCESAILWELMRKYRKYLSRPRIELRTLARQVQPREQPGGPATAIGLLNDFPSYHLKIARARPNSGHETRQRRLNDIHRDTGNRAGPERALID